MQESAENFIGRSRINVIGAEEEKAFRFAPFLAHQIFDSRNGLLVRSCPGVENIFLHFLSLILDWVEKQTVQLFKNWQHRFSGDGCPTPEHRGNFVLS